MKPILYDNLKAGDIVFTGGRTPFSSLIRWFTGGKGGSVNRTATHVGILLDVHGQLLMAEMIGSGLSISSLEEYRKSKRRFLITVGRVACMNSSHVHQLQRTIAYDRRRTIDYDVRGVLSFVAGKEVPEKFYCSEYVYHLLRTVGCAPVRKAGTKTVSPEELHKLFFCGFGSTVKFE